MKSISYFKSHDLKQQLKAELMQRRETKFLLRTSRLDEYLASLSHAYTMLEIGESRWFPYQSLYFDTAGMNFYRMHHNGEFVRYKVRIRRYRESGLCYLEIKAKENKQLSSKHRIAIEETKDASSTANKFVSQHLNCSLASITPSLYVEYRRCTLMSHDFSERVTIDTDLDFYSVRNEKTRGLDQVAVVEIKRERRIQDSYAFREFRSRREKPASFSKYCIGVGLTRPCGLKTNLFKPILNRVESMTRIKKNTEQFSLSFLELNDYLEILNAPKLKRLQGQIS